MSDSGTDEKYSFIFRSATTPNYYIIVEGFNLKNATG